MAWTFWDEQKVSFDFKPNGTSAMREGRFIWSELADMVAEIFPVPAVAGQAQTDGQGIAMPGFFYLRADSIHVEPEVPERPINTNDLNSFNTLNIYTYGIAQIKYITPPTVTRSGGQLPQNQPFNPDPVQLLEHRWSIGAEFLTINPPAGTHWLSNKDTGVPTDFKIGVLIPTIEHQITWPQVLFPPFTAMRKTVGKINNANLNFQTGVIEAGSLLFLGAELSRQVMSDGTRAWQVTYRFSERLRATSNELFIGWNVFWNEVNEKWDILEKSLTDLPNTFPYEQANFSALFQEEILDSSSKKNP